MIGLSHFPHFQPSLWFKLLRCQAVAPASPGSSPLGNKLIHWASGQINRKQVIHPHIVVSIVIWRVGAQN